MPSELCKISVCVHKQSCCKLEKIRVPNGIRINKDVLLSKPAVAVVLRKNQGKETRFCLFLIIREFLPM